MILRLPAIFLNSDGLLHSDSQVTANPFLQISILESALEQTEENLRKCTGASIGARQQTEENLIESVFSYIFRGSFATDSSACTQTVQAAIGKT